MSVACFLNLSIVFIYSKKKKKKNDFEMLFVLAFVSCHKVPQFYAVLLSCLGSEVLVKLDFCIFKSE